MRVRNLKWSTLRWLTAVIGVVALSLAPSLAQEPDAKKAAGAAPAAKPAAPTPPAAPPTTPAPSAEVPATPAAPEASAVAEAVELFKARNFDQALEKLKDACKKDPRLPPPWMFMAQFYSSAKMAGAVRPALERAAEETPTDPEAYLILGELALREHRPVEAKLLLEKGMDLTGQYNGNAERKAVLQQRGHHAVATLAELRGDWKQALEHLAELGKQQPDNAHVMVRTGRALFFLDQLDAAKQSLEKAAAADKTILPSDMVLAQLYQQRGDDEKTAQHLAAALTAHAEDFQTRLTAAQIELNRGNLDAAAEHAKNATRLDASSNPAAIVSGTIALHRGDYEEAARQFQQVAVALPNDFAATNGLALALCEQDSPDARRRALDYAQSNVQKFPQQPEALATLGWTLYMADQIDQAEQVLGRVFATGNVSAATAYYLARVAIKRGRTDDAKRLLQSALDTKPAFAKRAEAQSTLDLLNK